MITSKASHPFGCYFFLICVALLAVAGYGYVTHIDGWAWFLVAALFAAVCCGALTFEQLIRLVEAWRGHRPVKRL